MKRMYMAEQFDDYRRKVLHPQSPPVQILECKRAFFAGALAIQSVILDGLTGGTESTPADEKFMLELFEELEAFGRRGGI